MPVSAAAPATHADFRVLEPEEAMGGSDAARYDAMVRRDAWVMTRPFVALAAKRFAHLARARVLDAGCGPGWIPIELAKRFPGWEITAVDLGPEMLRRARENARAEGVPDRIAFREADAARLPFEDEAFDIVLSNFTLHHLPRPGALLSEMHRVASAPKRILLRDLRRPSRAARAVQCAFARRVLGYDGEQLRIYRESLGAALSTGELRALVEASPLAGTARIRGRFGPYYHVVT